MKILSDIKSICGLKEIGKPWFQWLLWQSADVHIPLQTPLLILGELSRDLMMSLFADGGVCLVSWTRHSLAEQKHLTFFKPKKKSKSFEFVLKVLGNFDPTISCWRRDHTWGGASSCGWRGGCQRFSLGRGEGGGAGGAPPHTVLSGWTRSVSLERDGTSNVSVGNQTCAYKPQPRAPKSLRMFEGFLSSIILHTARNQKMFTLWWY